MSINYNDDTLHPKDPKGKTQTTEVIRWERNKTVIGNLHLHLEKYLEFSRHRSASRVRSARAIKHTIDKQLNDIKVQKKCSLDQAKQLLFNAHDLSSETDKALRDQAIKNILESNQDGCEVLAGQSIAKHGWNKTCYSYLYVLYQKTMHERRIEQRLVERLSSKDKVLHAREQALCDKDNEIEQLKAELGSVRQEKARLEDELTKRPCVETVDNLKLKLARTQKSLENTRESKSQRHILTKKVEHDLENYKLGFRRMIDIIKVLCQPLRVLDIQLDARNPVGTANKMSSWVNEAGYTESGKTFQPIEVPGRHDWEGLSFRGEGHSLGSSKRKAQSDSLVVASPKSAVNEVPSLNVAENIKNLRDRGGSVMGTAKKCFTRCIFGEPNATEDLIQFS